jgi:hypothetical protein
MDEQEAIELGRLAVACKDWRWMPGMLLGCGARIVVVHPRGVLAVHPDGAQHIGVDHPDDWPDLRDPATLGCLIIIGMAEPEISDAVGAAFAKLTR